MTRASSQAASSDIAVTGDDDRLALEGVLDIRTLADAQRALRPRLEQHPKRSLDIGNLRGLDTPGALFLCGLRERGVQLTGTLAEHQSLLDLVCGLDLKPLPKAASVPRWRELVIQLGKGADDAWHDMHDIITFVGRAANATGLALIKPHLLGVPRLIALIITLPLLTFFADVMGIIGGAMISQWLLHVAPLQYLDRVHHAVDTSDLFVGLVKAPVFAFFIAIIGCMHGLRVKGSAENVGRETTRAVVKAIFLVIVLDALFSVFFERVGL